MTREDIVRKAREAGFSDSNGVVHAAYQLEAFAALIASAEREACAKLCDEIATEDGWEGGYAYRCVEAILKRGLA